MHEHIGGNIQLAEYFLLICLLLWILLLIHSCLCLCGYTRMNSFTVVHIIIEAMAIIIVSVQLIQLKYYQPEQLGTVGLKKNGNCQKKFCQILLKFYSLKRPFRV
jgi:hypothetical protein